MTMLDFFKIAFKSFKPDENNEVLMDCEKIRTHQNPFSKFHWNQQDRETKCAQYLEF